MLELFTMQTYANYHSVQHRENGNREWSQQLCISYSERIQQLYVLYFLLTIIFVFIQFPGPVVCHTSWGKDVYVVWSCRSASLTQHVAAEYFSNACGTYFDRFPDHRSIHYSGKAEKINLPAFVKTGRPDIGAIVQNAVPWPILRGDRKCLKPKHLAHIGSFVLRFFGAKHKVKLCKTVSPCNLLWPARGEECDQQGHLWHRYFCLWSKCVGWICLDSRGCSQCRQNQSCSCPCACRIVSNVRVRSIHLLKRWTAKPHVHAHADSTKALKNKPSKVQKNPGLPSQPQKCLLQFQKRIAA